MFQLIKNKLRFLLAPYTQIPSLGWWLMAGAGITNLINFACLPFLAIILARQGTKPLYIGMILGAAPLIGLVVGFISASLSDYLGRRRIILAALYLWAISFILFFTTSSTPMYALLSACLGLSQALFEPTSQALLSDLVPKDKIKLIYKLRYLLLNIGFAFGPLLGALLALINEKLSFVAAGFFFTIFAMIMTIKTRHLVLPSKPQQSIKQLLNRTFLILNKDRVLLHFLIAGIFIAMTYSQFESTFPQYLFSHGHNNFTYAALLMVNALGVLIFQLPISKLADKTGLLLGMQWGGFIIFIGYLMIAFSNAYFPTMLVGMLFITWGELFISPVQNVVINHLATPTTYGLYFGAYNLRQLGFSIGPILGSYLLGMTNGMICFFCIAIFGLIATYFFKVVQEKLMPTLERNSHVKAF